MNRIALWWFGSSIVADTLTTTVGIVYGHGMEHNPILSSYSLFVILVVTLLAKVTVLFLGRFLTHWEPHVYPTALLVFGMIYWIFSINNLRVGVI